MKSVAVIGGGVSGLTFSYFLDKLSTIKSKKINIDIIEKNSDFARKKIRNFQYNQEIYDNGWYNSVKDNGILFQMILELGLYRYLIECKKTTKLLYSENKLKSIPEKLIYGYPLEKGELISSDIFSLKEKGSIFLNLYKNTKLEDLNKITVEDFFIKKINFNVYKRLIEPLLTSYYGSDISKQNFSLLMPDLAFASIKNNDIQKNMSKLYENNVEDGILNCKEYRLKFTLRSFVEGLESHLSSKVFREFNNKVIKIETLKSGYLLTFGNKKRYYDYVVISNKHTEFLEWFDNDKKLKNYYKDLKFYSNILITLVIKKDSLTISGDIGEIIFSKEDNKYTTKIEYVSNKWVDIKSQNIHLLRVYINRQDKVNELLNFNDEKIIELILAEIKDIHSDIELEKYYVSKVESNYIFADKKYAKYINEIDRYLAMNYDKIFFIGNSKKSLNLETTIIEAREAARYIIEKI